MLKMDLNNMCIVCMLVFFPIKGIMEAIYIESHQIYLCSGFRRKLIFFTLAKLGQLLHEPHGSLVGRY